MAAVGGFRTSSGPASASGSCALSSRSFAKKNQLPFGLPVIKASPHPRPSADPRFQSAARCPFVVVYARNGPGSSRPGSSLDEGPRIQQLESQVFELKQRLVEAEVKRQAAEKVASEALQRQQQLEGTQRKLWWVLALLAAFLLLTTGVLAWAELEAPPLGTMPVSEGGFRGMVMAVAERVTKWWRGLLRVLGLRM